ncbi:hypothetical protein D9758_015344 [Tetrapyrgos nigripes]|uniref:Nucleoplasmin-like domain-containing protein n=1 Tax=Tetrapyrgos nigripes TaxID=182062 RepID=A0A8H5FP78_9AGAR|nr:hypothetical protein D9758_015344 [Tetrapyrgos nigripes]
MTRHRQTPYHTTTQYHLPPRIKKGNKYLCRHTCEEDCITNLRASGGVCKHERQRHKHPQCNDACIAYPCLEKPKPADTGITGGLGRRQCTHTCPSPCKNKTYANAQSLKIHVKNPMQHPNCNSACSSNAKLHKVSSPTGSAPVTTVTAFQRIPLTRSVSPLSSLASSPRLDWTTECPSWSFLSLGKLNILYILPSELDSSPTIAAVRSDMRWAFVQTPPPVGFLENVEGMDAGVIEDKTPAYRRFWVHDWVLFLWMISMEYSEHPADQRPTISIMRSKTFLEKSTNLTHWDVVIGGTISEDWSTTCELRNRLKELSANLILWPSFQETERAAEKIACERTLDQVARVMGVYRPRNFFSKDDVGEVSAKDCIAKRTFSACSRDIRAHPADFSLLENIADQPIWFYQSFNSCIQEAGEIRIFVVEGKTVTRRVTLANMWTDLKDGKQDRLLENSVFITEEERQQALAQLDGFCITTLGKFIAVEKAELDHPLSIERIVRMDISLMIRPDGAGLCYYVNEVTRAPHMFLFCHDDKNMNSAARYVEYLLQGLVEDNKDYSSRENTMIDQAYKLENKEDMTRAAVQHEIQYLKSVKVAATRDIDSLRTMVASEQKEDGLLYMLLHSIIQSEMTRQTEMRLLLPSIVAEVKEDQTSPTDSELEQGLKRCLRLQTEAIAKLQKYVVRALKQDWGSFVFGSAYNQASGHRFAVLPSILNPNFHRLSSAYLSLRCFGQSINLSPSVSKFIKPPRGYMLRLTNICLDEVLDHYSRTEVRIAPEHEPESSGTVIGNFIPGAIEGAVVDVRLTPGMTIVLKTVGKNSVSVAGWLERVALAVFPERTGSVGESASTSTSFLGKRSRDDDDDEEGDDDVPDQRNGRNSKDKAKAKEDGTAEKAPKKMKTAANQDGSQAGKRTSQVKTRASGN